MKINAWLLSLFAMATLMLAEIPSMINYQGILTNNNGTIVTDGNYSLSFSIFEDTSGGSQLWSETHSNVEITQGLFNVMLGSISSLAEIPFDTQYYLQISVDGEVMADRIAFSSTAYSLNARSVNGNQGIPSGGIIMWSGSIEEIPDGWALCDGNDGRPDLRDKFILGAGNNQSVASTGGSNTHSHTVDVWPSNQSGELLVQSWNNSSWTNNSAYSGVNIFGTTIFIFFWCLLNTTKVSALVDIDNSFVIFIINYQMNYFYLFW